MNIDGHFVAQTAVDVAVLRERLAAGLEQSLERRLLQYFDAIRAYEKAITDGGCESYSVIEIPKVLIADALLEYLRLPLGPRSHDELFPQRPISGKSGGRRSIPSEIRWQVWERDNFTCKACGIRRNLTVDHIVALANGGTDDIDNFQTLCGPCNSRKGTTI